MIILPRLSPAPYGAKTHRFRAALAQLREIEQHLTDGLRNMQEREARDALIKACERIARDYGDA